MSLAKCRIQSPPLPSAGIPSAAAQEGDGGSPKVWLLAPKCWQLVSSQGPFACVSVPCTGCISFSGTRLQQTQWGQVRTSLRLYIFPLLMHQNPEVSRAIPVLKGRATLILKRLIQQSCNTIDILLFSIFIHPQMQQEWLPSGHS